MVSLLRSWVLALVVALSILPTVEVTETVMHLIEHGDLAHDEHDGRGVALGSDEHGCSGTFHLCGHVASMISPTLLVEVRAVQVPATASCTFPPDSCMGRGAMAPPIRPPIA